MLAYNCSPSFNWAKKLQPEQIADFQQAIGALGYKFQFVTLAGFHSLNHSMFTLARGYKERGMAAYSELQQAEFASEADGYSATRHQREVGTSWFDAVAVAASGGKSSTTAMAGSTETDQFHDHRDAPAMVPQRQQQPAANAGTYAHQPDHDHDDGLVHSHRWAVSEPEPAPAIAVEHDHDDGLVHGHNWAVSDR